VGAWQTHHRPFDGWGGERWEFDPEGTGRVISASVWVTAGILGFDWRAGDEGVVHLRFEGDQWRAVPYVLRPESPGPLLTEQGSEGFCGSDGPLVPAGDWPET
jgi:hypothetical protein